ncbi:hypothetical protein IX307_002559 [Bacteroides pyogenes]|uniref:lipid-binding protein n=1 Tax=Bacteroides pyogenes TaxID=310300 RepID=UPI001BA4E12E|nr:lipid-binding protein [Bacteroides pyogenes]MBR8721371.1 hypothetical protein [Bacteroides pyogenes]MBR8726558.1 hypothetical protein [Bacteroides pyogenes]MBR8739922.1 hypothetical protein [Bacteroides pyogenes]MBR8755704.1 hypothetical protein [Bacteroides pyogenes]MBR8788213.1 hypothetical protein [Bacteroides pyogenes]
MKRFFILIGILCAAIPFFSSCQKDIEIWDSATLDYSGRYVIKIMNEDMSKTYMEYDNSEVYIYNTSANIANEMWIDDTGQNIPLKSKFKFIGTPASFKSAEMEFDKLTNNILAIGAPSAKEAETPVKEGESVTIERDYLRAVVIEGKIIPEAVTTKGGNKADSLYLKLKFYSGTATFKSIRKPEKEWKDPNTPEFAWGECESVGYDETKDEVLIIGGHKYTGFSEDLY